MPDDLYWRSTPREVETLVEEMVERITQQERAAAMRAGLVTAAIYNVNRKEGSRVFRPGDFVREPPRKVSHEEFRRLMGGWASRTNGPAKA